MKIIIYINHFKWPKLLNHNHINKFGSLKSRKENDEPWNIQSLIVSHLIVR